jgi:hypothetical protein
LLKKAEIFENGKPVKFKVENKTTVILNLPDLDTDAIDNVIRLKVVK